MKKTLRNPVNLVAEIEMSSQIPGTSVALKILCS
jgi:hypothetical protein